MQYSQDNDEMMPYGKQDASGNNVGWAGSIYPYVMSVSVYKCPDDPTGIVAATATVPTRYPVSYTAPKSAVYTGTGWAAQNIAAYNAPASPVILFETQNTQSDTGANIPDNYSIYVSGKGNINTGQKFGTGGFPGNINSMTPQVIDANTGIHTGGSNFICADGHAKWQLPGRMSSGFDTPSAGAGQSNGNTAAGTGCMDNTDNSNTTCANPNGASLTFSKI